MYYDIPVTISIASLGYLRAELLQMFVNAQDMCYNG